MKFSAPATALMVAGAASAGPYRLDAQVAASVDLGVSDVRYDGFLPSAAASLSPSFRLERPRLYITGRGTLLRFESGNVSLQANASGSLFSGPLGRLRVELTGNAGSSRYADFASFSHLLLGPRLHLADDGRGMWIGATLGTTSFGANQRPVTALAAGAWTERSGATWLVSLMTTGVGDTAYIDFEGGARYQRGRLSLEASVGVRGRSTGAGRGVYGEASGALAFHEWLSVILSGGRYPTDPIRGSVSGRYVGLSLRVGAWPRRTTRTMPARQSVLPVRGSPDLDDPPAASVATRSCACGGRTLVILAPGSKLVEVSGDFTDWNPVVPATDSLGAWVVSVPLAPGTYRFNLRLDGGEWMVPAGATRIRDEFGSEVGILVVP